MNGTDIAKGGSQNAQGKNEKECVGRWLCGFSKFAATHGESFDAVLLGKKWGRYET